MVPIRATYLIFIYVNPYNEDISEFLTNASTQSLSHDFSKSPKNRQGLIRNMENTNSVNTVIGSIDNTNNDNIDQNSCNNNRRINNYES